MKPLLAILVLGACQPAGSSTPTSPSSPSRAEPAPDLPRPSQANAQLDLQSELARFARLLTDARRMLGNDQKEDR